MRLPDPLAESSGSLNPRFEDPQKNYDQGASGGLFAEKFQWTRSTAPAVMDELAGLAIRETKKTEAFTLPGIGKLVLSRARGPIKLLAVDKDYRTILFGDLTILADF